MHSKKEWAWQEALSQLAIDYNVKVEDLLSEENTLTQGGVLPNRRKYTQQPPLFQMVTTGRGAVMAASPELHEELGTWVGDLPGYRLFEYPKLRELEDILRPRGWEVCGTFHMFLPRHGQSPAVLPRGFSFHWYDQDTVKELYPNSLFPNALSSGENSLRPDVIALAAFDGDTLVALAGASADGEKLWQVGIDVLPSYRGRGLGKALVAALCARVIQMGKVPFYGTAAANLHSQNIAVGCGFFPAWVEVSSRPWEK